jgi:hypothetical protein
MNETEKYKRDIIFYVLSIDTIALGGATWRVYCLNDGVPAEFILQVILGWAIINTLFVIGVIRNWFRIGLT